jgi:NifB/MoaA-like Fe-S oxidoreductase
VEVHAQVVVCPGVNDGDELERTLGDVISLYPGLTSVALVPIGVSDFSMEEAMRPHTAEEAAEVVALAERYQALTQELLGRVSVYASDEFYLVAGQTPPPAGEFESLDQAENGIGLVAAFSESFANEKAMAKLGTGFFQSVDGAPAIGYRAPRTEIGGNATGVNPTILTGEYAAPILRALLDRHGYESIAVQAVKNDYFGGNIKVAGLMTGADLAKSMADSAPETLFILPDVCLSEGRFLDGLTLEDLPSSVLTVPTTGIDLRRALDEILAKGTLAHA